MSAQAIGIILLTTIASVSFTLCYRNLYEYYGINSKTFMNGLSLLIIAIVGKLTSCICKVFPESVSSRTIGLDKKEISPLVSVLFGLSVVAEGLSQKVNYVGIYQYSLLFILPCVLVISFFHKTENFSINIIASVLVLSFGIGFTITPSRYREDILTWSGFFCCLFHVLTSAFHQVLLKQKFKELNASPLQLLVQQTSIASVIILVCSPIIDGLQYVKSDLVFIMKNFDCMVCSSEL